MITIELAEKILSNAEMLNGGKWVKHSYYVAESAKLIAASTRNMDSNKAYIYGLLHDIGRYCGVCHLKHVYMGMEYMDKMGYYDVAKICLTHSFPIKDLNSYSGKNDLTESEWNRLNNRLENTEYDDYDRLIQLCDAISSADGFCIMEVRLVDVAIRNGINNYTIQKWKKFIELKDYFCELIGCDIYKLLKVI